MSGTHRQGAGMAERSYPASQVRGGGREEQSQARGQGRRPGGPTPHPRSRGCLGAGGLEELFHIKVRRGGDEEIPLVQGKEQRLRFAGAAMRRYPMPKLRETQVRP